MMKPVETQTSPISGPIRAGLVQLNASDDPAANLPETARLIREAAAEGADLVLTPEVTNIVSVSGERQAELLQPEAEDRTLASLRNLAAETGIHLVIGSLALKCDNENGSEDGDGCFVNRSFLIGPDGGIIARYDKIHMFDVDIDGDPGEGGGAGERYRESKRYRPGARAIAAETALGRIGLSICYDMRFPALYRALAEAGAQILTAPSAFTIPTGRAHWHVLLRARAIETGCFVLAPAQWGSHAAAQGRSRETWGHSLAVDPWGRVLADAGEGVGVTLVGLDLGEVEAARKRIPALANARSFAHPVDAP